MTYPNKKGKWSHMVASDIQSLHKFAESIGLKKCWFNNKRGKNQPHYDVSEYLYQTAIQNGATPVSRQELFLFLKNTYS